MQEPKQDADAQLVEQVNHALSTSLGTSIYIDAAAASAHVCLSTCNIAVRCKMYLCALHATNCHGVKSVALSVTFVFWLMPGEADEASDMEQDSDAEASAVDALLQAARYAQQLTSRMLECLIVS